MTLAALIETHDEAALSALASVGVVRRAGRDLEGGKARVEARDEVSARVEADGHEVVIREGGLSAATCSCPATGICRHIVLAVLALRDGAGVSDATAPGLSVRDELAALSEVELRRFAGADWDKAIAQARISGMTTLADEGTNLSVLLPDTDAPVVFLAGLGLGGAVYKGPKTTKRRVVTAAALVARMECGAQALDDLTRDAPDAEVLDGEVLGDTLGAIEAIVGAVFAGGSVIAEERLFDLSISARAQAAPRLTALLRDLVRHSRHARARHFAFADDLFLADAAFAYALTLALQAAPGDPGLTGVLRRTYSARADLDLLVLGAVKWQADGGARGARFHCYSPTDKAWFVTGQARGAGMDPSFQPQAVYNAPLWRCGRAATVVGKALVLEECRVSADNQISWEDGRAALADDGRDLGEALEAAGVLFSDWSAAWGDIRARLSGGLRRSAAAVPVLLKPSSMGEATFDDMAQVYRLPVYDARGGGLELTLAGDRDEDVRWLQLNASTMDFVLCEVRPQGLDVRIEPVTAYIRTGMGRSRELSICNLTFDQPGARAGGGAAAMGGRALSLLKTRVFGGRGGASGPDPLVSLCDESFEAIAETMRFGMSAGLEQQAARAESMGLATLRAALLALEQDRTPRAALRASYLASEIQKSVGRSG